MKGIGGNTIASIQTYTTTSNEIGEDVRSWQEVQTIKGWLDMSGGGTQYGSYNAKIEESTHIFIADYVPLAHGVEAEKARLLIDGKRYDITLIDNPMGMGGGSQLEIFLKYTGGQ